MLEQLSVDGGKVRLRTPVGEACIWRDYAVRLHGQATEAWLQDNAAWLVGKAQPLESPPVSVMVMMAFEYYHSWHQPSNDGNSIGIIWMKICIKSGLAKSGCGKQKLCCMRQSDPRAVPDKLKQAHNFSEYLTKHRHRCCQLWVFSGWADLFNWLRCCWVRSQTNWQTNTDFRRAVESGKCSTSAGSPLCLSQWPDYYLNNLQGDMLPNISFDFWSLQASGEAISRRHLIALNQK